MEAIYRDLAAHLDNLPGGYPATESGVELRILKRLFSPEEAELAVCLTMLPETASAIAERTGRDEAGLADRLEGMARKGLLFRLSKDGVKQYAAAQFVVGIWEYHINDLDEALVRDVNAYLPHLAKEVWEKHDTKHLRVIPVSRDVTAEMSITPYEVAEEIIKAQSKIVVQPCICRKEHEIVGDRCAFPMEVCLSFGSAAYYYEENGLGRTLTQEEALAVLEKGRDAGLVLQPANARKPFGLCMCCGCCCQILKNVKRLEKPAEMVHSNYYAHVEPEECVACEVCVGRCQMDAIRVDGVAVVDRNRCIGCGLCVGACMPGAMKFVQKDEGDRYVPPGDVVETYMTMARERGKI